MLYHLNAAADGRTVTHAINHMYVYNSYDTMDVATVTAVVVYIAVHAYLCIQGNTLLLLYTMLCELYRW